MEKQAAARELEHGPRGPRGRSHGRAAGGAEPCEGAEEETTTVSSWRCGVPLLAAGRRREGSHLWGQGARVLLAADFLGWRGVSIFVEEGSEARGQRDC